MIVPKHTLTAIIEQLYEDQIASLERASNPQHEQKWEKGEAFAYAEVRKRFQSLRARGKSRIV